MRTILLCILLFCTYVHDAKAQAIGPEVNENVELMSILARMAGYPEYNMDMAGQYIKDMDEHFKSQTKHPAVLYMKELRNRNGISYDAVMSMALHLNNRNGTFSLIDEEVPTLDKRWAKVDKAEFMTRLGSFYKDAKFNGFFNAHKALYEKGLEAYRENVMKYLDTDWYSAFYGKEPQENFSVIIGFCNGGGNYGADRHIKGCKKEVFAIVGYYVDKDNRPMYSKDYLPTLVHEFNHSFVNYLLDEKLYPNHVKDMEQAATSLFELHTVTGR